MIYLKEIDFTIYWVQPEQGMRISGVSGFGFYLCT